MKIRRNEIMRQREICSRLPLCSPSFWSHFCFFHPFRLFFSPLVLHITHYELRRTNRNKLMITEEDAINFVFCKIDTRVFANFVINLKAIILTLSLLDFPRRVTSLKRKQKRISAKIFWNWVHIIIIDSEEVWSALRWSRYYVLSLKNNNKLFWKLYYIRKIKWSCYFVRQKFLVKNINYLSLTG